jgi:hypothetical protein
MTQVVTHPSPLRLRLCLFLHHLFLTQPTKPMERLPRSVVAISVVIANVVELLFGPIPNPPLAITNTNYVLLVKN